MSKNYFGDLKQLLDFSKDLTPEKAYILGVVSPESGYSQCKTARLLGICQNAVRNIIYGGKLK